ncbi:MAG: hypothetical protein KJZ65_06090 [Phycisphaerales bacterium]|nr:hypothetical protein [Phycisphaerales bacterium]
MRAAPRITVSAYSLAAITLLKACTPTMQGSTSDQFVSEPRFNQRLIEYAWNPTDGAARRLPSDLRPADTGVRLDVNDPASVVAFVLEQSPAQPIVYPTERYYYFEFSAGPRRVAGNLRFTDAEKGVLHTGYFDRYDSTFLKSADFQADGGLALDWNDATRTANVQFRGIERTFQLPRPRSTRALLLPGESDVAAVLDESGFTFHLLFHEPSAQFYFALDDGAPLPDTLIQLRTEPPVWLGVRSRFVFVTEPALRRRVLVGVYAPSVRANDYYDGPFDQVPPDLYLKDKLEAAYPYVKFRGGIDEHGNFREIDGQRVAISPYQDYTSTEQMIALIVRGFNPLLATPACFAPLVYESKRDTHRYVADPGESEDPLYPPHDRMVSRTWPVEHWAHISDTWPREHTQPLSLEAAPNEPIGD